MLVEKTAKEIIIRLSADVDPKELTDFLNFARYKEIISKINVSQNVVDKLSVNINSKWWEKNKSNYLKL
jgi:hypothetical protein